MSNLYAVTFFYKFVNKIGQSQTRSDVEYYEANSHNDILSLFNSISNATITKISKVHYDLSQGYNLDSIPNEPSTVKKYKYTCNIIKDNKSTVFIYYDDILIDDNSSLLSKIQMIDNQVTDLIIFVVQ